MDIQSCELEAVIDTCLAPFSFIPSSSSLFFTSSQCILLPASKTTSMVRSNIRLPPVLSRRCDDTEKHSDFDNREDYILTEHETLYAFDPLASNDLGPYGYTPGAEMKHVAGEASARLQALVRSGPRWKPVYIIVRRLERTVNEQLTPPQSRHWAIRVEEYVWDIAKDGKPFGNCLFNGKKRWSEVRKNYPQVFLMGLTRKTVREIDRDGRSTILRVIPSFNIGEQLVTLRRPCQLTMHGASTARTLRLY